jgi:hypothetical protein
MTPTATPIAMAIPRDLRMAVLLPESCKAILRRIFRTEHQNWLRGWRLGPAADRSGISGYIGQTCLAGTSTLSGRG